MHRNKVAVLAVNHRLTLRARGGSQHQIMRGLAASNNRNKEIHLFRLQPRIVKALNGSFFMTKKAGPVITAGPATYLKEATHEDYPDRRPD